MEQNPRDFSFMVLSSSLVRTREFHSRNSGSNPDSTTKKYGLLVQLEKHLFCRQESGGRIPYGPLKHFGSLAQLEERFISTEEVTGPNPVCIHYAALAKMVYAAD